MNDAISKAILFCYQNGDSEMANEANLEHARLLVDLSKSHVDLAELRARIAQLERQLAAFLEPLE